MKAAAIGQGNIAMDIENGVMKMKKLLDLTTHQRNSWKTGEKELRKLQSMVP